MSYEWVRRCLRIAAVLSWVAGVAAAVACTAAGVDSTVARELGIGILIAVITGAAAVVEVVVSVGERVMARMPAADELAARAVLRGRELARDEFEALSEVPRISDYRSR